MAPDRHFLLHRDGGRIRAADATPLVGPAGYPPRVVLARRPYALARDDQAGIPWFWDELRDEAGAIVGFALPEPAADPLLAPLLDGAENAPIVRGDAWVLLAACAQPRWECVQGFGCAVYRAESGRPSAALLLHNFSGKRIGFDLGPAPAGAWAPSGKGSDRAIALDEGPAHPLWDRSLDA